LRRYHNNDPAFVTAEADPVAMLRENDAALLIGDHALSALESRDAIEAVVGPCEWFDIAHEWVELTGKPWVAAVWAVRPEAIREGRISAAQLIDDVTKSRERGLMHIEDLVGEWKEKLQLSAETIRHYLTRNIHYVLDDACLETIRLFRNQAAEAEILPPLPSLNLLHP
jgi:chorismate dehydratase